MWNGAQGSMEKVCDIPKPNCIQQVKYNKLYAGVFDATHEQFSIAFAFNDFHWISNDSEFPF